MLIKGVPARALNIRPLAVTSRFLLQFLFALILLGLSLNSEDACAGTLDCSACHGQGPADWRPLDSTDGFRHITSGAFKGNHSTHVATTTSSNGCVMCHGDITTYTSDHRNGQISMAANINTSPGATYSTKGLFFNQTSVPVTGTCSNVNCHFEATTPTWGSAPADTTCSTCHLEQPSTGSHTTHETKYGGTASCITCHAARTTFQHATSAGNAGRTIDLTALAGTYTGSNFNYLPSQSGTRTFGTCSSLYCHSSGQGTTANDTTPVYAATPPVWGGTAGCGSCHATTTMASGSHTQHLALSTNCGTCHTSAAAASYNSSIHVDGSINVGEGSYTAAGAPGNGYGTCSAASCHGSRSPVWGANTTNATCTKCHGKGTILANYSSANAWQSAPGYATSGTDINGQTGTFTNGVSSDAQVGAHDAHLRAVNGYTGRKVLCSDCHAIPVSGQHANGATDYTWSSLAKNLGTVGAVSTRNTLTPGYAISTCSTNYCHGGVLNGGTDTSPAWNDTAYLTAYAKNATNCGKCHGAPPTSGATLGYDHSGVSISNTCTECHGHEGTGATHIDGNLQAAGGACDACHGYDTVDGVWGAGGHKDGAIAEGWGAHAKHINHLKTLLGATLNAGTDTYGSANFNAICGVCHTQIPANHTMNNSSQRLIDFNGSIVYKTGSANPFYNGVSGTSSSVNPKTCSNISCHVGTTPRWQ